MAQELDLFRSYWNPTRDLNDLQKGMNRLFEDFNWLTPLKKEKFTPACDIEEMNGQYLMNLDLPGVKKEDIKIELVDRDLIVSGERKEEKKEDKKSRHVVERFYGSFQRMITLPTSVNPEQIQATFENGVLKVTIPKVEAAKTKQIKIIEGKTPVSAPLTTGTSKNETKDKESNASVRIA